MRVRELKLCRVGALEVGLHKVAIQTPHVEEGVNGARSMEGRGK